MEEDSLYLLTQLVKTEGRSFSLQQALRRILMSGGAHPNFCSVHVQVPFLESGVWEPEQPHQGIGRGCAVGGSSWEGSTLPGKAARQLWHGHPLQTWKRASALSLSFERGHFCPVLWTRLALSSSLSWEFQGSRSPSSGRKKLHTYWIDFLLPRGWKPSPVLSCFLTCPVLIN